MTVKELIEKLNQIKDKDATVYVGCQGYTNIDDPEDEYDIRVYSTKIGAFICDSAYYNVK